MLRARTVKNWYRVHKWTSLICTVFLLLLCLTGLPLIFYEEIDHLTGNAVEAPALPPGMPPASIDRVVAAGLEHFPGEFVQYVVWDDENPGLVYLSIALAPDATPENNRFLAVDARSARPLNVLDFQSGVMPFILSLHVDMFAGLPGKLFLGLMGLLFVISIVSGVVVYGPFMRRLDFGTVRKDKSPRIKWLDLHNLLGIVTLLWALVVGGTGVINTWADLVIKLWQADQIAELSAPYAGKPIPSDLASLDQAVAAAGAALPGMVPSFVAYPGSLFSSRHHYAVFMRGETPLTSKLLKPVLIDAVTGEITAKADLPWYVTALLVSQPLHFGNYGGMPMKIIWALLDLFTIVVLGSGVYLWLARRRTPFEARLAEIDPDMPQAAAARLRR